MDFEEMFDSWSLEEKVEWILGPNIFNLTHHARSIIVDLKKELKRFKNLCESYRIDCDKTAIREANAYKIIGLGNKELTRTKRALWLARAERAHAEAKFNYQLARRYEEYEEDTIAENYDAEVHKWKNVELKCRACADKFREEK